MCGICGCAQTQDHVHEHAHDHTYAHDHDTTRVVQVERALLARNDRFAADNRASLQKRGVLALNLVSSPGSGKTTLLVRLIERLKDMLPVAVIEGDQQTSRDADRIRATGVVAVQINTGEGCHLDAHGVGHALESLPLAEGAVLFIENVGNLVCPAGFDLGEAHKVVVLSTTEGEDKPLKYPNMFAASDLMVLNKTDLLPHLDFDVGACIAAAHSVNRRLRVLQVSARTGDGIEALADWIAAEARLAAATRLAG